MNDTQRWAIIGALWIIAISLLIWAIGSRYTPLAQGLGCFDKWTGRAYKRYIREEKTQKQKEKLHLREIPKEYK